MKYKVIFFDVDNTLLDFDRTERYALEKTLKIVGYPYSEKIVQLYEKINKTLWRTLEEGKIDVLTLKAKRFEKLVELLGIDYEPRAMSHLYEEHLGEKAFEIEGAYEVCKALSKQYEIAVITNGISQVQNSRIAKSSFHPFINKLFISEEIGISKPAAAIFEYALREMGNIDESEALMVGDSLSSDMKGSQNAGMDSCFFNPKQIDRQIVEEVASPTYEIKDLRELIELLK